MNTRAQQTETLSPKLDRNSKVRSQAGWQGEMFASRSWRTALEQFARATSLSVTLFDRDLELRMGPFIASPLTKLLADTDCWNKDEGYCSRVEVTVARSALKAGSIVHHSESGMLALCALPLYFEKELIGVVVSGWALANFPDPVLTDRFAKRIDAAFQELWQTVRQQAPVSKEKLQIYGELLNSLCVSFIHERAENLSEQEQSRELLALNESAKRLAIATSAEEIGEVAVDAVINLSGADSARLVLREGSEWHTAASRERSDAGHLRGPGDIEITQTLRIPLEAEQGATLGVIELSVDMTFDEARHRTHLPALAAQTAIALQKLALIEDLKRERASLERANRSKDEFLALLSHELRTPLTPIMGWVSMLRDGADKHTESTIQTALAAIERNACQELHLVNEMLDLSRILNDKIVLELELLDPNDVLASAFANARLLIGTRNLKLELDVSPDLPRITADPSRLQQVLTNLMSNAVKFTEDGGSIVLGARVASETCVEFFIKDSGVGIRPEILPHIFERFRQADSSTSRQYGGLGIGLSVVRGLVELHGGTVWAKSEGEGRGASFIVSLPISATGVRATSAKREELRTHPNQIEVRRSGRVLVVDDSSQQ
ncbi:MAG TPA: ATP-binding protein [Pyrinomonadaceae bacterium]|nr:ATP-binding protein [Pyrinomonadaceae bacterium]